MRNEELGMRNEELGAGPSGLLGFLRRREHISHVGPACQIVQIHLEMVRKGEKDFDSR